MKLILLGAPGAGKGTQAEIVCDKLNIPAISTGNILREAMKNETEMGVKAKAFIDSGALVPDDVIIGIIKERLAQDDCKNGFILDGVPRTVAQAEALEEMGVGIDKVVDIEVSDERIIQRLSGRRVCSACGASYHTTAKPSVKPDVCDRCGRADRQPCGRHQRGGAAVRGGRRLFRRAHLRRPRRGPRAARRPGGAELRHGGARAAPRERDGACHRTDGKRKKPRRKNHVRRMDDQDR